MNIYDSIECPNCGNIVPIGKFCIYCGEDVSNEPIYIRARDCITRKYKKETISILDVNSFLENVFKLKNFSLKAIYYTCDEVLFLFKKFLA